MIVRIGEQRRVSVTEMNFSSDPLQAEAARQLSWFKAFKFRIFGLDYHNMKVEYGGNID